MSGIHVPPETVETNIVIFEVDPKKIDAADLVRQLQVNGVLMFQFGPTRIRAVMHLHITDEDVAFALSVFRKILA